MDGKGLCHAYSMPKKVGVTMLISDDLIFKKRVFPEVNREILIGNRYLFMVYTELKTI